MKMKKVSFVFSGLIVVFAISALAGPAFAASPEWIVAGKPTAIEVASITAEKLGLEDMSVFGGPVAVICETEMLGVVGPVSDGEVIVVDDPLSGKGHLDCQFSRRGPCLDETAEVEAVHLPWLTELLDVMEGGVLMWRNMILNSGAGAPGFEVECTTILGKVTDTCTGETSLLVENFAPTKDVTTVFDEASEAAACSMSGAESGLVSSMAGAANFTYLETQTLEIA
jgi:hypothetical protein